MDIQKSKEFHGSQAQFDEYREKIAGLEKKLQEANANKPNEEEINALKLKVEGIFSVPIKNCYNFF